MRTTVFRKRRRGAPTARREGAAAVEFAMVATPFFLMIFAVLELGLVFLLDASMETAVNQAGRLVRTGQAETQAATADRFKAAFCSHMTVFEGDCSSRAEVDVRIMPRFSDGIPQSPIKEGVLDKNDLEYDLGEPGDLMLVRVWYSQPLVTPLMSQAVSKMKSGDIVLSVATAFRTEPYRARAS